MEKAIAVLRLYNVSKKITLKHVGWTIIALKLAIACYFVYLLVVGFSSNAFEFGQTLFVGLQDKMFKEIGDKPRVFRYKNMFQSLIIFGEVHIEHEDNLPAERMNLRYVAKLKPTLLIHESGKG